MESQLNAKLLATTTESLPGDRGPMKRPARSSILDRLGKAPVVGSGLRILSGAMEKSLRVLLSRLYWKPLNNFRFRQVVFDTAPAGTLLVAARGGETLLVAAGDQVIGRSLFVSGEFDFEKLAKVVSILSDDDWKGELLIDVGANIGPICIPAVRRGFFSRAIAIEPEPFNYALLAANIQVNNLGGHITALNIAFGGKDYQELAFELSATNLGDHRVRLSEGAGLMNEGDRKTIAVRSETFDSTIAQVDPRSTLIWIDTQGFEGHVLSGASKALSKRVPLVIEFWPYAMSRSDSYPLLKDALLGAGYREYLDLNSEAQWVRLTASDLDRLHADLEKRGLDAYTDLLLR
jgi:FkbM family methyltransferase